MNRKGVFEAMGAALLLLGAVAYPSHLVAQDASSEKDGFKGRMEVNAKDSTPDWKEPTASPKDSPNILLILLDDVGFADTATFGGLAQTPTLDALAAEGLRYNRFHTAGICSPTRAALLTGRNQHRVGYGSFGGVGYPGYDGIWRKDTVSIAEILRRNGYSTAAFGKWHNTPFQEISPIGPFDRWPTYLGFEYFYGNVTGGSSQWEPRLWRNTEEVAPPLTAEQGYHFTTDITNEAIRWVRTHDSLSPDKPYFAYFATEAAHGPHHVPKEWIEKYRGRFEQGWDTLRQQIFDRQKELGVVPADATLTRRPEELPAWTALSDDQRRLFARQMEVFAAFLEHTDHEIGRLIQAVKEGPHADNTLILFVVGDNGGEAIAGINGADNLAAALTVGRSVQDQLKTADELGGPNHNNYHSAGWAWLGSTPFQWMKHVSSHFGATRNPLVVSWPARIRERGGVRSQFGHVNDIAATIYEAARIKFPDIVDGVQQAPLDGVSLVETFEREDAPSRHRVQYFEAEGNRAIYQDGWVAAARHAIPWERGQLIISPDDSDFARDRWELYHVDRDFSQAKDLASRYPEKLQALERLFDAEARRNDVYPLGAGFIGRRATWTQGRKKYVFHSDMPLITGLVSTQGYRITVDAIMSASGARGALFAQGGRSGGIVLYVKDDRLIFESNLDGNTRETLKSGSAVPAGNAQIVFEFDRRDSKSKGEGRLYVNGGLVAASELAPLGARGAGVFSIGQNAISPVSNAYDVPFKFNGTIDTVTLELK